MIFCRNRVFGLGMFAGLQPVSFVPLDVLQKTYRLSAGNAPEPEAPWPCCASSTSRPATWSSERIRSSVMAVQAAAEGGRTRGRDKTLSG